MKKLSTLGLSLAVIAILGLSGCGGSSSDDNTTIEVQDTIVNIPTQIIKKWETSLDVPESVVYDKLNSVLYVSNVNASFTGDGWSDNHAYISKLDKNGKIVNKTFINNLKSPKGLVLNNEHLYIADIDNIVDVNITDGNILNSFQTPNGENRLNSLAYDKINNVLYASESNLSQIFSITNEGDFSIFYNKEQTETAHQNGIILDDKKIIMQAETGNLKSINIDTKEVKIISNSIDNIGIDGITKYYSLGYIISSDEQNSKIYFVNNDGTSKLLATLNHGAGDILYCEEFKLLLIPNINDKIIAYEIK